MDLKTIFLQVLKLLKNLLKLILIKNKKKLFILCELEREKL